VYQILPGAIKDVAVLKTMDRLTDADFVALEPAFDRMIE
jgi:hypothetical protein